MANEKLKLNKPVFQVFLEEIFSNGLISLVFFEAMKKKIKLHLLKMFFILLLS